MAFGGWSRGVHWSSLGTVRSGAGTEIVVSRTESHSCVVLRAPGVSAFESHKVGLTLPPPFRPLSLEVAELSISCFFFCLFSSWSERLSSFVLTL